MGTFGDDREDHWIVKGMVTWGPILYSKTLMSNDARNFVTAV